MSTDSSRHLLFLSHAGADTAAALTLAERIEASPAATERGLKVWIDKRDLELGESWQSQLEQVLESESTCFAVYVGSSGVINWVESEVQVALSRARRDTNYPFIPILSRKCHGSAALPAFARQYQGVNDVENNPEELKKLVRAATRQERATPIDLVDEPFLGLRAFSEKDTHLFFGRDQAIAELTERLKSSRLLMVVGDSGSGKSSLVKAGLMPRYRGGALEPHRDPRSDAVIWHILEARPRNNPFDSLADGVAAAANAIGRKQEDVRSLRRMVRDKNPQEIADALSDSAPKNAKILVVVDQFEELFTLSDHIFRAPFVDTLLFLSEYDGSAEFRVVLTMRRDYYNLCREYPSLYDWLEDKRKGSKFFVRRMSDDELRSCIENPLALTEVKDPSVLVDTVLRDVGDQPGDLALLEMALTESWQRRHAFNGDLLKAYTSIGGTAGALATVADEVYDKLDDTEKAIVQASFMRLVRLGDTGGTTRRVADRNDFSEQAWQLLQLLATKEYGRLVHIAGQDPLVSRDKETGEVAPVHAESSTDPGSKSQLTAVLETVELAHEALVSQWPRYQGWLQAASDLKRKHDALIPAAKQWAHATTKKADYLLRAHQLSDTITLLDMHPSWLSENEQAFFSASRKQAQIRKFIERGAVALLVILTVAAILLAYNANLAKNEAKKQQRIAEEQLAIGDSRRLSAQASQLLGEQRDLSLLLGLEAMMSADTAEARLGLLSSLEHNPYLITFLNSQERDFHKRQIAGIEFSPDGQILAAGTAFGEITLWDVSSHRSLTLRSMRLPGATRGLVSLTDLAFSPDGSLLATCAAEGGLVLWDTNTFQMTGKDFESQATSCLSVAFSPDGRLVASATVSGELELVIQEVDTGERIREPLRLVDQPSKGAPAFGLAFSPSGEVIAAAVKKSIYLWTVSNGRSTGPPLLGHDEVVLSLDFSPDGKMLASTGEDGKVLLWDVSSREQVGESLTDVGITRVRSVDFSPDGKFLAAASKNLLWEVSSQRKLTDFTGYHSGSTAVAFSPDSATVATGSFDGTIMLWDVAGRRSLGKQLFREPQGTRKVVLSANGKRAAIWGRREIFLRELRTVEEPERKIIGTESDISGLALSPDSETLVFLTQKKLVFWDVRGEKERSRLSLTNCLPGVDLNSYDLVDYSPQRDGLILVNHRAGVIVLIDIGIGDPSCRTLKNEGNFKSLAISPDGRTLALGGYSLITLFDVEKEKQIASLPASGYTVNSMEFTSDSRVLASASAGMIQLWDVIARKQIGTTIQSLSGSPKAVALSPDGKTLASAGTTGGVELWDIESHQRLSPVLKSSQSGIERLVFSADGRFLFAVGFDGFDRVIHRWDLDFQSWQIKACSIAARNLSLEEIRQFLGDQPYRKTCTNLQSHPTVAVELTEKVIQLMRSEDTEEVLTVHSKLRDVAPLRQMPVMLLNELCWVGSLCGFAPDVLDECEQALELDPNNVGIRDSRGIARAMTGNYSGAKTDFQYFVERAAEDNRRPESVRRRQEWIEVLNVGSNPFAGMSPEELCSKVETW